VGVTLVLRCFGFWVFALLAVQAPFAMPAAAAEPVARPAVSSELAAVCDRIAALILPVERFTNDVDRTLPALVGQMITADPNLNELESAYPGMGDAMVTAWRPIFLRVNLEMMPLYRADMAGLYCSNFTLPELREVEIFLRSPAFQAMQQSAFGNVSVSRTMDDALEERDISSKSIEGDLRETGVKAARELSPQHKRAVTTFMASPLGRKMMGLTQQKLAIDTKWANYLPPWAEDMIQAVTIDTMIAHIAKTDPGLAQEMRTQLAAPNGTPKRN
jgi:hypothetical protein